MDNLLPRIHGIDYRCRSLCALEGEAETVSFLVGTQSMKADNVVHLYELDEEFGELHDISYPHPPGEVWHVSSSAHSRDLIATCHSHVENGANLVSGATVWRLSGTPDEPKLENLGDLAPQDSSTTVRMTDWGPEGSEGSICSLGDTSLIKWDIDSNVREHSSCDLPKRSTPTSLRWNPHSNGNQVGITADQHVRLHDLRTMKCTTILDNAHAQTARDLDFNPNRQYFLATCGDDCATKFWDSRNFTQPLLSITNHSHWVWRVRYNLRDQLLLTGGSDSKVVLLNVPSLASDTMSEEEEEAEEPKEKLREGVLEEYDKHEDSVYSVAWSTVDPWLFASLSNDGRLVLNKVSKDIKFSIIL